MAEESALLLTPKTQMPQWRRSMPKDLVDAFEKGAPRKFRRAIRKLPPFSKLTRRGRRSGVHPYQQVHWSKHAFAETERSAALAELLRTGVPSAKSSRKLRDRRTMQIAKALDRFNTDPAPDGFELLAWMNILVHESSLSDDLFLGLWRRVATWMQPVLETSPDLAGRLTCDQRALLLGELPWTYGILFSHLQGARRIREDGAKQLRRELLNLCADDGMPHASLLNRLALCVAPFTRAAELGKSTGDQWLNRQTRSRYRKLVLRAAALLKPDGRTALSNGVAPQAGLLLQSATRQAGLKKSNRAALLVESTAMRKTGPTAKKKRLRSAVAPRLKKKHRPSAQSDRAQLACLRNNWGVGADACIIAFDGAEPRIDLTAFGVPVLSGDWGCSDNDHGVPTGGWECVCWFTDSNVDYVELQNTGAGGNRVLRQALLSRDDHFLLLSDAVHSGNDEGGFQHRITLPLRDGASAQRDSLTREWSLQIGPLRMRVLPLALQQSGIHPTDGNLTIDSQTVTLTQSTTGQRLACPLLLDWSPVRRKAPAQWKQLTVAENGRILTGGEATAVRWRIGDGHWLYFHALDGSDAARTALGMHTLEETVIAEVTSGGDVENLVEVAHKAPE